MTSIADAQRVVISDLEHAYDAEPVLRDIDLVIEPGESLALLGPSGCGKTTLLRAIAGLERPARGTVTIGDQMMTGPGRFVTPEHRRVGMVFQDWALFPHLTVAANVGYGLPRKERAGTKVATALDLVGLADLAGRMPETLSGGQQQRVALARALAPAPSVLLLDEPFSNLDTRLRIEVRTEVHRLLHDVGITAVFVTHDQEEAFVLGDRIAVMRGGRLVQVDTPHGLYTNPADREIAEFVGSGSLLRSTAAGGKVDSPCGPVAVSLEHGEVDVLFRPEQLEIIEGDTAVVDLVEYYGHDVMVFVRVADDLLRVRCGPSFRAERGDRVGLRFLGDQAHAFPATGSR